MNDEHRNEADQHDDQIETLLRDASTALRPDDETKQAIRARVLGEDASDGDTSGAAEHNSPKTTRRRFAWAASVALLVTGAIIGSFALWPSPLTLAAVAEALEEIEWIYIKYDNGEEIWRSPSAGVYASRAPIEGWYADGLARYRLSFGNARSGERYSCSQIGGPRAGYIEKRTYDPRDSVVTIWDRLVKPLEDEIKDPGKSGQFASHVRLERHEDALDDRRVIRFDTFIIDVLEQKVLTRQLWADPATRLPIRIRTRNYGEEREDNPDPGFTNGVFEFPESGPTSIYDLGAARDLPIVDWETFIQTNQEVASVMEAMRAAERRFPENFRWIHWRNKGSAFGIDVIHMLGKPKITRGDRGGWLIRFEGVKSRKSRYSSWEDDPQHLKTPATAEQVLAWTSSQTPVTLGVCDGERYFRQYGPSLRSRDPNKVILSVNRPRSWGIRLDMPWWYQWSVAYRAFVSEIERFEPDPQALHLIGLRVSYGDTREEFIVDAVHDYICIEFSMYQKRGDVWFKQKTDSWGDFERLPSGAWFATSHTLVKPDDPVRGTSGGVTNWLIHIEEIDPDQLPPETFDGDLLLEKAKALGATITTY